jgi:hypothetical protein
VRGIVAMLVVASLLGAGCSRGGASGAAPEIDDLTAAQLQARAFQRACLEVRGHRACLSVPLERQPVDRRVT